jgi:hypothetical protein
MKATKIIKSYGPPPYGGGTTSTTLALHTAKGVSRVSSLINPENLEGRVPVKTMSGQSPRSLKHYCVDWNNDDIMEDTASSGYSKTSAKSKTIASGSSKIPANPKIIAIELFKLQQRLYQVACATTISIFYIHISPVPKNASCPGHGHLGFSL